MFSRTLPQPDRKCVSLGFVGRNQFVLFLEISADFKFQNVMFLFCVKLRKKENHLYFGSNTISFLLFHNCLPNKKCFFLLLSSLVMHQEARLTFAPSLIPRKLKTKTDKYKILAFFFLTDIIVNVCIIFSFFGLDNHWLFWA